MLREETVAVGESSSSRCCGRRSPRTLIDEEAFADDEFLPYWAELWPAAARARGALPERLDGLRVLELGCGLGVPSLVAAARGANVTAVDWAATRSLCSRATPSATTSS